MTTTQTPEVTWAQRSSTSEPEKNYVYITISVPDVPKDQLKLDLKPTGLTYSGDSTSKKTKYHVDMEFFAEIDPENSKINHTAAHTQMILRKKELKEEYWPRLLKDTAKVHYLRTDFDKWVDEDEQNEVAEDDMGGMGGMGGMEGMEGMGGMGGMGGMPGMGGMGGMGGDGGFGGIDFSKLGAMGGMGGAGMPGMEGMGMGEDDGDDEDGEMPELEDEKPAAGEGEPKGKSKIEEVA